MIKSIFTSIALLAISVCAWSQVTPTISISSNQGNSICVGTSVTFTSAITNGGSSPTYQWKKNNVNVGTGLSTYSPPTLVNGDVITCVLTSSDVNADPQTVTSNAITMTVLSSVTPSVSLSANSTTMCAGGTVTFTATPTNGGSSPSYQWIRNGSNVGTNTAVLTTAYVNNGDVFSVQVTSSMSCASPTTANSNTITMSVVTCAPNDECSNAVTLTQEVGCSPTSGTTVGATNSGVSNSCAGTDNDDVWYKFVATSTDPTIFVEGATGFDAVVNLRSGSCGTNSSMICVDATASGGSETINAIGLTVGATYFIRVYGYWSAPEQSGNFNICVYGSAPTCTPSVSIASNNGSSICTGTSVVFTATPTNGGSTPAYQWKKNGSNVGTGLVTYSPPSVANGDVITCVMTSNAACASPTTATSNAITMTVSSTVTPSITISSNQGNTICSGTSVVFSSTTTGEGSAPTYQWKKNGTNVGTGLPTYSPPSVADGDVITCIMTSNAPCATTTTATSNSITMTVAAQVAPTIAITSNQGTTICVGTQVVFSATVTGEGSTPTYQWKKNGTDVGTGLATYTTSILANGDVITCELTSDSPCANPTTATSNTLTMTVDPQPIVLIEMVDDELHATSGFATYQWGVNGNEITGETNATYTPTQNGEYFVRVTSAAGCEGEASFSLNNVSVESLTMSGDVLCYPNPTTGNVVIELQNYVGGELKVLDNTGRVIVTKSVNNGSNSVDLSNYEAGIFHFVIRIDETITKVMKVVKK